MLIILELHTKVTLDYNYPENSVIGAFYTGLYASYNQSFPYPPATCSTGNCTWPPYRSLGVCTQFANLTSQLQRQPDNGLILPNGLYFKDFTAVNVTSLPLKGIEATDGSGIYLPTQIPTTIAFPHLFNRIADIIIMYIDENTNGTAYEAVLYYCIQEFSTNMTNGILQTAQIGAWANDSESNGVEPLQDFPTTILMDPYDGRNYTVAPTAMWAIRNFTNEVMTGTAQFDQGAVYSSGFAHVVSLLGGIFTDKGDMSSTQTPQQTVDGRLALEVVMENIAQSLSNE